MVSLWSCGGSGGSGGTSSGDSGTLSLGLVDAPDTSYKAVYVSIKEVRVCTRTEACVEGEDDDACECVQEVVAEVNKTYNLLELVNGVMETLIEEPLEVGTYNQMRLILSESHDGSTNILGEVHPFAQYLIDENEVAHKIKVPSGYQSGIKLVHPFEITAGAPTELILDFDVKRSVVKAGSSRKYLLKPTIKVFDTYHLAEVSGTVYETGEPPAAMPGATVTAWRQVAGGEPVASMSTATDAEGGYMLYLNLDIDDDLQPLPTEYKLVATANGYEPACTTITVTEGQMVAVEDLILSPTVMTTVTGTVSGQLPTPYPLEAPVVEISFSRQVGECFLDPVETDFIQVTDVTDDDNETTTDVYYDSEDGSFQFAYSIDVVEGIYNVTASTGDLSPKVVEDYDTAAPVLDIVFDAP
jgi:hypothetical protein